MKKRDLDIEFMKVTLDVLACLAYVVSTDNGLQQPMGLDGSMHGDVQKKIRDMKDRVCSFEVLGR